MICRDEGRAVHLECMGFKDLHFPFVCTVCKKQYFKYIGKKDDIKNAPITCYKC